MKNCTCISGAAGLSHDAYCIVNSPSNKPNDYEWTDTQRAMTLALTRLCIQVIELPQCEETALRFAQVTFQALTNPRTAHSVMWLVDRLMQVCIDLDANERRL